MVGGDEIYIASDNVAYIGARESGGRMSFMAFNVVNGARKFYV